jgi:hypothetical protein
MMSGRATDSNVVASQGVGDGLGHVVDPGGVATQVEQAGDRGRMGHDHPGSEVGAGHITHMA